MKENVFKLSAQEGKFFWVQAKFEFNTFVWDSFISLQGPRVRRGNLSHTLNKSGTADPAKYALLQQQTERFRRPTSKLLSAETLAVFPGSVCIYIQLKQTAQLRKTTSGLAAKMGRTRLQVEEQILSEVCLTLEETGRLTSSTRAHLHLKSEHLCRNISHPDFILWHDSWRNNSERITSMFLTYTQLWSGISREQTAHLKERSDSTNTAATETHTLFTASRFIWYSSQVYSSNKCLPKFSAAFSQ